MKHRSPFLCAAMLLACGVSFSHAEIRQASGLSPDEVWAAIDAAQDGDTVQLPAGTSVWTTGWNSRRRIKMKAITIQGAGMDKTVIVDGTSTQAGELPFDLIGVEGKPFRITGIAFDGTSQPNAGLHGGMMTIRGDCKDFRIDHCLFKNAAKMMEIRGDTYGVIDHCAFHALEVKPGLVQTIKHFGPGKTNFRKPLTLGTDKAVYFEDNDVRFSAEVVNPTGNNPWIVPFDCARIVVRHNQIVNTHLEIYRAKEDGSQPCQSAEIYANAFSGVGLRNFRPQGSIFVGGGVVMVFDNTVTGATYNHRVIPLRHERATRDIRGFGKCDGANPIDGNQIPVGQPGAGYPGMGQPGRATDADGDGIFDSTPCHAWNNRINGEPLRMVAATKDPHELAQLQEGRDFINEPPKANTYQPFIYPHPLTQPSK